MKTLVALHAHPDDEAIFTGGLLALAAAAGWRTVVVFATGGELGAGGNRRDVAAVRRQEAEEAAPILSVDAVEFLGYQDSGMDGWDANTHPGCLATADLDHATDRLARVLARQGATALSSYDRRGVYGHPDHVAVHRMARRAHRTGAVGELYEATVDPVSLRLERDRLVATGRLAADAWPRHDLGPCGSGVTPPVCLDVSAVLETKRAAIAAHASQVIVDRFMGIPAGAFERLLGREWYHACSGRTLLEEV